MGRRIPIVGRAIQGRPTTEYHSAMLTGFLGNPAISLHTVRTPPRDQWAAATIAALSGGGAVGVVVRAAQDPLRAYRVTAEGGNTVVWARTGATATTLAGRRRSDTRS